jgi:hypothetical protein
MVRAGAPDCEETLKPADLFHSVHERVRAYDIGFVVAPRSSKS